MSRTLPPFSPMKLEVLEDTTARSRCDEGFVKVRRRRCKLHFADGTESAVFSYDMAERDKLDAVAIIAHYKDASGETHLYLRSAFRPPALLRPKEQESIRSKAADTGQLWELPAGLVEADERSEKGLRNSSARELHEEVGFRVSADDLHAIGVGMFPTTGLSGEQIFFYRVEVDPAARGEPEEDGPLEKDGVIVDVTLSDALDLLRRGEIEDMKTELGIRRLADYVSKG